MTSLQKRVLSAAVFLPFFLLLLIKGSPFHFFLLVAVTALLGLGEFYSLKETALSADLKIFSYVWGLLLLYMAYAGGASGALAALAAGLVVSFLIRLRKTGDLHSVPDEIGFSSLGILYVVFLFSYLILLRGLEEGGLWIIALFLITWSNDTAAYFSGLYLGKRKLYPEISPKKSVEGFIGGFAGGVAASIAAKAILLPVMSISDSLLLGAVIGIIGPLGDLSESMLKRSCSVKDSGGLIPGHGGILDRVDSILFSAPFVYYFAAMKQGWQV